MKNKALYAVLLPVTVVGAYVCLWPRSDEAPAPQKAATAPAAKAAASAEKPVRPEVQPVPSESVDIAMAIERKVIVAEFIGNGRERMKVMLMNKSGAALLVKVPLGQMFESDRNMVVAVHAMEIVIGPGKTQEITVPTAATRSANVIGDVPYQLSYASIPRIEPFLLHVQEHPELPPGAVQTGILALTENLPLSAVAKFALASNPLPSRFNTDAFRTETFDIMAALQLLREAGVQEDSLAITIDQQLKIEAMIDPSARPLAMRYYAIDPEREWDFWRNELLNGEPCTRHYALYGIARFYPDVAIEMLPRWARETRTNPVYRLSAVQALADTQRPEALTLLRTLSTELGPATELGKAATGAADYLDYRLAQSNNVKTVAFRASAKETVTSF
jgi:hypothetical protein